MKKDKLNVNIYETRKAMGEAAAADIAAAIKAALAQKEEINMIFAAAPSQNEVLDALVNGDTEWNRVNAYHMDEYIGLDRTAPQSFGNFLTEHIFGRAPFKSVNLINCGTDDPAGECARYEQLLKENPVDIVVCGIGENGHVAFNDPWVANFKDEALVKIVELDEVCRQQQVNDGCFGALNEVPKQAMTLTLSFIMNVPHAICTVPTDRKANAVLGALCGPVTTECPASILRQHNDAALFLDAPAASKLPETI